MSGQWHIFVDDRPWDGGKRLFMRIRSSREQAFVAPLALTVVQPGMPHDEPTLSQTREEQQDALGDVDGFLQAALDAAWEIGLRPKAYADHTNELKAVRYHLEDMRQLAKLPRKT